MPDDPPDVATDSVDQLIARGEHAAAAALAVEQGQWQRAVTLYRLLWRYADALPLAARLGDLALAVELALDASRGDQARELARSIPTASTAVLARAAQAFAARGEPWEAGGLAERAGEWELAARYYRRAGSHLDAGRMDDRAGRVREAGLAYEQALAAATDEAATARAHEALGRLLGRLGQHREAARSLQLALRVPAHRLSASRALVAELASMGLRIAAAEVAARIHREYPEQPDTADAIVAADHAEHAHAERAVQTASQALFSTPDGGLIRGRFRVLRLLGAGATSQVYWAEDTLLGHDVALKLLTVGANPGAVGAERAAYQRFAREAEAVGRLRHPNIVALFDADPAAGMFVMERMTGGTLADRLAREGALRPGLARRLALDLLSALAAAHDRGLVHRDVKPANILFDAAGNAKLADFGAAHLADFGQTQTGGLMGTVAYMSPEQISGAGIGPRADLYAAGVTLFEALTGRLPFPGPDIVSQHLGQAAPRASQLLAEGAEGDRDAGALGDGHGDGRRLESNRSRLLPCHDETLLRALEKAPEQRWSSAEEMADAIRAWPADDEDRDEDRGGPAATPPPSGGRAAHGPAGLPQPPSPAPPALLSTAFAASDTVETEQPVGRSAHGSLVLRDDPRLHRPVLIERRLTSLDDQVEALRQVRNAAAAGGPFVQRILGISEDGRSINHEWLAGPRVRLDQVPPRWRARLAAVLRELIAEGVVPDAGSLPPIVMTASGPVVLVCVPSDALLADPLLGDSPAQP